MTKIEMLKQHIEEAQQMFADAVTYYRESRGLIREAAEQMMFAAYSHLLDLRYDLAAAQNAVRDEG